MTKQKSSTLASADEASMSASKRIYLDLRQQIVDMTLLPGTRIVERDLAQFHEVSRTPVHEAVQRLSDEGLIEVIQRVGTFVARIPLDKLEEAIIVRTALEVAVVEKAATRIKIKDIVQLNNILKIQHSCVEKVDYTGFHRSDEMFHEALTNIAGLPSVWQIIQQTKIQVDRYRQLTLSLPGRMDGVVGQHQAIADALEAKSIEGAVAAMREHLSLLLPTANLANSFRPEYFVDHL